ncbi:MAG TPA: flagellar basal body L-ring protein FlgH [Piscirickettsiaceae bacterium]|nr:flagellar basal body L-ring protein FlgH [Piscirickettsiaceae bacterium]HIQ40816.1 flagellar basal body L-ring protein FlgH [Sulfurivirga caldicuralii]
MKGHNLLLLCGAVLFLAGCSSAPERMQKFSYEPAYPVNIPAQPQPKNGSLFQGNQTMTLFDDARAHRVGDIITINLIEKFKANKKDESKYSRNNDLDPGGISLFGRTDSQILAEAQGLFSPLKVAGSKTAFQGKSDVKQDSSITGKIAVMVTEVLPNGNLVVRGERWITVSDGEEVVRFAGIIRPQDIQPDNTIDSTKVADVRLIYQDTGYAGDVTRPSAAQKWFTKYWPF